MKRFSKYRRLAFEPPATICSVQNDLLRQHIAYCAARSPFYKDLLSRKEYRRINVSLASLERFPFTEKSDLERRNDDFLAVRKHKIADIVLSSGTTGIPTRIMYTARDLERLAYNEEKSFAACGVTKNDVALLSCTLDRCFVAGLAYYLGMRNIGAAAVRCGQSALDGYVDVISRIKPTVIVGVPTFLRKLALFLQAQKVAAAELGVKKIFCIGEPLRDRSLNKLKIVGDLEALWDARVYSTYASSETITTFCECPAQQGGHLHPDLAVAEIIDAKGCRCAPGEPGEVVITPLRIEGMPLVRFKTGDISFLVQEPCLCGSNSPRLGPIIGRKKHMMKVKGTTIYPQAIYAVLENIPGVADYYVEATSESSLSDLITVYASIREQGITPEKIQAFMQSKLRVKPAVVITNEGKIRQKVFGASSRKPVRFFDGRK